MRYRNNFENKIRKIVEEKKLTYSIDTMGCQMNENDSAKYMGILESMGFKKTTSDKANVILFNTCCVRENAENTLFGRLGYLKQRKLKEDDVYIVVVGCMTQQRHILEKIKESYRFVDIVLGTNSMNIFPVKLYKILVESKKEIEYVDVGNEIEEDIPIIYEDKYKASVSIIYGCNNFCSYCIVPYVRGRERSRNPKDILSDIEKLAKKGYKEIMLLGQNVNSYGNDFKDENKGYTFAKLLCDVEKIEGIEIIRFMSPHPKDFKDDVIEVIKNSKKIARQIHLPLQSGSTRILKEMNRKYTKEHYLELAYKIKEKIPNVALTTDIIVGFPGETEEDFKDTLDIVEKLKFEQVFMFIYSRRKGTVADKMKNQIPEDIKHKRFDKLKALVESQIEENNKKYIGTIQKVLIDGTSKTNENTLSGRTDTNKVVVIEADKSYIDKIVNVKITQDCMWYLKGEIV